MNSSGTLRLAMQNGKRRLALLHEAFNAFEFSAKGRFDPGGPTLTPCYTGNVGPTAFAESQPCRDTGIHPLLQLSSVYLWFCHVICCRSVVAFHGYKNNSISHEVSQGESVSVGPSSKPAWAEQITNVRKRLKLSQEKLAEALSTSQSNVAKWETGAYKPSPEHWMGLARLSEGEPESLAFMERAGVPSSFFMKGGSKGMIPTAIAEDAVREAERRRIAELAASGKLNELEGVLRHIPLLRDAAAAGTPRAIDEREIERLIPLPRDFVPRAGTLFAIKVKGDSMDPILLEGHIAIVDVDKRDPKQLVNCMVVARDDGITIKWLREDDGEFLLVPHHVSVRHPVRRLRRGTEIVGLVVKWIGQPPKARR